MNSQNFRSFNGSVDEPRIYDVALTQSEVQGAMNQRHPC
jgi:hypothetical protein